MDNKFSYIIPDGNKWLGKMAFRGATCYTNSSERESLSGEGVCEKLGDATVFEEVFAMLQRCSSQLIRILRQ